MNTSNINVGGWPETAMRKWMNETMIYNLPTVWRNVIKSVQVLSSAGNTSASIVTSIDKLFLFSQAEVGFNKSDVPYCNEVAEGAESVQFPIFTDSASRIKKPYNGTGTAASWWLRSPFSSSSAAFAYVSNGGNSYSGNASYSYGVAFGFCI